MTPPLSGALCPLSCLFRSLSGRGECALTLTLTLTLSCSRSAGMG